MFCGGTGTGKTTASVALARQFDPSFTRENYKQRIARGDSEEFGKLLQEKDLPIGAVNIFDEVGVGQAASNFQSPLAKAFQKLMIVRRYKQRIVIMSTPAMPDALKSLRRHVDYFIEITDRDDKANLYVGWVSSVKVDRWKGDAHRIRPRIKVKGMRQYLKLSRIVIKGLPRDWREELRDWIDEAKDKILEQSTSAMSEATHADEKVIKVAESIGGFGDAYIKVFQSKRIWNRDKICKDYHIGEKIVGKVIAQLKEDYPQQTD